MWASADECRRRERFSIQHVVGTCGQNSSTAGGPRADFYTRGLSQGPISRTLRAQVASPACSGLAFLDQTWIHFSYLIYQPADLRGRAPVTSIDDNKALVRGFYDGSPFLARVPVAIDDGARGLPLLTGKDQEQDAIERTRSSWLRGSACHSNAYVNLLQRDEAYRALRESQRQLLTSNADLRALNEELSAVLASVKQLSG